MQVQPTVLPADEVRARIAADYPCLEALYRHIHAHPELSLHEERTAALLARELRAAGAEVTEGIGGHGVVGVLRRGDGPTIMVRGDTDALPVTERTGLPYASAVRARDAAGREVGVMHACAHDLHTTCLAGVARALGALRDRWRGTLVLVGQPAEEHGSGARAMLADGLFERFPRPAACLGLHGTHTIPGGSVGSREGPFTAGVNMLDLVVRGRGGHGAMPHAAVDSVVLAARVVLDLQTLVSRENDPLEPAVLTVGSIHGGTKHNIIPEEVRLQITVRYFSDAVRAHLLEGIERIAKAAAHGARAPEPSVIVDPEQWAPALTNDPELARRVMSAQREALGAAQVIETPPLMGSEDFAEFIAAGVPGFYFWVGVYPPEQFARAAGGGPPLPGLHSPEFAPDPDLSIRTGVLAMSTAALALLGPGAGAGQAAPA
ncbi:MAG: amidohydrolase [Armatimonadetes bacterium]|nr:amidohydrolase [Armatimonadota bacterium]